MENSIKMARESILGLRVCAVFSVFVCAVFYLLSFAHLSSEKTYFANYFLLGNFLSFYTICTICDLSLLKIKTCAKNLLFLIFVLWYPVFFGVSICFNLKFLYLIAPFPMVLYVHFVARNPELFYEKRNFEFPFKRNMLCACGAIMPLLTVFFCSCFPYIHGQSAIQEMFEFFAYFVGVLCYLSIYADIKKTRTRILKKIFYLLPIAIFIFAGFILLLPLIVVFILLYFPNIFEPHIEIKTEVEIISALFAFIMSLLCYVLFCMDIVKCKMGKLKKFFYIIFLSPITISVLFFFIPIIPLILAFLPYFYIAETCEEKKYLYLRN